MAPGVEGAFEPRLSLVKCAHKLQKDKVSRKSEDGTTLYQKIQKCNSYVVIAEDPSGQESG